MESKLITLTTDFGQKDPFVGIMKGVIWGINPHARVIDLSHGIPSQDVTAAALVIRHSVSYFPRGSIHVAVVDPEVGGGRNPILMETDGRYFIGPDNGVLSLVLEEKGPDLTVRLSNTAYHLAPTSATFHGRDIFAPVAAHLSLETPSSAFGEPLKTIVRLPWPKVIKCEKGIEGEIVYVDGFGNLFTNIGEQDLRALPSDGLTIALGSFTIRDLAPTYVAGNNSNFVALINSWGLIEIALYKDSAQKRTGAKIGDKVQVW